MRPAVRTPTPWTYTFETLRDDWGEVRDANGHIVAKCSFSQWTDAELTGHRRAKTDPAREIALLMSAAPDLYAALERIVASVARCQSGDVCQTSDFDDARAALAKARGERVT